MEEHRLVTLKLIGFNEQDCSNLAAVLTLASRALKKKWRIVEQAEANFFLLSLQASAPENRQTILKDLPAERCLFCLPTTATVTERSLLVDEKHLPRLSVLVALFNQLSLTPQAVVKLPDSQTLSANLPTEPLNEVFFNPHQGLLGYLLAAQPEQLIISLNNQPQLYLDKEKNSYYSVNNLEQFDIFLATPETFTVKSSSKPELEQGIVCENLKPRPLRDLIWYLTLKTSSGKVVKGHMNTDIVTLKSWPDLRLFKFLEYAKVATFMKHNAAPLEIIAEQTKNPLAAIHNFYNACYLTGLIETRPQIEINKKNITPELSELLTKIDARLK